MKKKTTIILRPADYECLEAGLTDEVTEQITFTYLTGSASTPPDVALECDGAIAESLLATAMRLDCRAAVKAIQIALHEA